MGGGIESPSPSLSPPPPPPPRGVVAVDASEDALAAEPSNLTGDIMDRLLARELQRLSLEDREKLNEEIHGVQCLGMPETPKLITEKLTEMEEALDHHNQHAGTRVGGNGDRDAATANINAYKEALSLGSQYVHDPDLRAMFLRAEFWDAQRAAVRFVSFLQLIREFLGPGALVHKPWTLDVFTKPELKQFKKGAMQLLPGRDRFGRRVMGVLDEVGSGLMVSRVQYIAVLLKELSLLMVA
jgi:hypothetical protein